MNRRQKKKIAKRLDTYVSVLKKEPPKERWFYANLSNRGGGIPVYIEKDGRMFYKNSYWTYRTR